MGRPGAATRAVDGDGQRHLPVGRLPLGSAAPHAAVARDLAAAWNLFDGDSRRAFRDRLDFDEESWQRARGYALARIFNVAYYEQTNPDFSADAVRVVRNVLADGGDDDQRRLTI